MTLNHLFGCPKAIFGPLHLQGVSLGYLILILLYLIWSKSHWQPRNDIRSQSPAKHISRVETRIFGSGVEVLTNCACSMHSQCIQEILLEIWYLGRGLSKILWRCNFIFYGICNEKQKGPRTNHQPLLSFQNMFRSFVILWSIAWPFLMP